MIPIPIIQGAMGVRVSTSSLVSAVSAYGGAGTIPSVGLGYGTPENETDYFGACRTGLQEELRQVRAVTQKPFGVNIMVALSNYEDLVRTAAAEDVDFIVSGAGLPLQLPKLVENPKVKLIPIVSSSRACAIIIKGWLKKYNRLPDAVIVEGPLAGGHLGFSFEELMGENEGVLERLVTEVLTVVSGYEHTSGKRIPVIAAGGIFTGADIARFMRLGAAGVQMGTRFVATHECLVHEAFKQRYCDATEEDVIIIKSPVGMPGRAIKTPLIERAMSNQRDDISCNYICLRTCQPATTPYCIAKALFNAVKGDLDDALVFAGSNVPRVKKIVSVAELMDELIAGAVAELS